MTMNTKPIARRNRWLLLAFLATFIVPIVIGQLAYDGGWYQGGQTNRGELLSPPLTRDALAWKPQKLRAPVLTKRWWVVYSLPEQCLAACQQSLLALPRMHDSIGRERERLGILFVLPAGRKVLPEWLSSELIRSPQVQWVITSAEPANTNRLSDEFWYVMDPMGWIMLRYRIPSVESAAILRAQDVLDDLAKLLKVSRIG